MILRNCVNFGSAKLLNDTYVIFCNWAISILPVFQGGDQVIVGVCLNARNLSAPALDDPSNQCFCTVRPSLLLSPFTKLNIFPLASFTGFLKE